MYKQLFEWKKKPQFCLILILFGKVYRFISFLHKSLKGEMGTLLWKYLRFWIVAAMTFQGTGLNRWPKNTSWEFFEANKEQNYRGLSSGKPSEGAPIWNALFKSYCGTELLKAPSAMKPLKNYLWQSVILWKNLGLGLIQTQPSGLPSFRSLHFPSQV